MKRTQLWCIVGAALIMASTAKADTNNYKWYQPPVPGGGPTNLFNGWNQESTELYEPNNIQVADDWVCTTTNPVTKVRWWGSFANWQGTNLPPNLPGIGFPQGFWIIFFSDVPAGNDLPWSHPGGIMVPPNSRFYTNYTWRYVGQDLDPRTGMSESCFLFEQELMGDYSSIWWFSQTNYPTGTNTYWLSIVASQWWGATPPMDHFFGWKTRPRSTNSLSPDAAVTYNLGCYGFWQPAPCNFQPIWWPEPTNTWDLAFELITAKWEQPPDLTSEGIDVNATSNNPANLFLLADDFQCTSPGPITNITIWGSWLGDNTGTDPANVVFTLSFHTNVPASTQYPWSMPGAVKWTRPFQPGQFTCTVEQTGLNEWWMDPPNYGLPGGDQTCYRYDFAIPTGGFNQQGTVAAPATYWLDVQAQPQAGAMAGAQFGWKTSTTHWMDAACWVQAAEQYNGNGWQMLTNPPGHSWFGNNIDLAFRLNNAAAPKWSQPPVLYTPTNAFNGWNEYSVYGGSNIVADDWVCTNATPVTDIHWWGSFIGWTNTYAPMPNTFVISIWSDVPKGTDGPFSHPGVCLTNIFCGSRTPAFVGWDYDPRNPGNPPDACFEFQQDLSSDQWFFQAPGTNIYWISIAAQYPVGPVVDYPWGWKTRPRTNSLAPDDAVRIFAPTMPDLDPVFHMGANIWWPTPTNSWDMAFALTTRTLTNCVQVVCSTNITITCAPVGGTIVYFQSYTTNICTGEVTTNVTCTPSSGSLFLPGNTQVWCTNVTAGVTNYCSFWVTVRTDTTAPVINCASSIIANTDPGFCSKSNVSFVVTATDDCDPAPVITCNPTNGSTFSKGVTTVNCTARDAAGNSTNCSFTVTILDQEPPTIFCSTNIVVNSPGCGPIVVNYPPATASDNCAVTNVSCVPPSGSLFAVGTNLVRCAAIDSSGNSNTCSFTVTVTCHSKWVQGPDLSPNGFDVRVLRPKILANDFLCTKTGPITNIHIWASWLNDQADTNAAFQLGLWGDVPGGTAFGKEFIANGTFELAFNNAGFSDPLYDGLADFVPPSWVRVETFSGQVVENSFIGPVAINGPSAPGSQAAKFSRSLGSTTGDWTAIYQDLSINAARYSQLTLSMDVRVISHVLEGGGDVNPAFEWPAVVEVDYLDTNGVSQIWRYGWYLNPPGDSVRGPINDPGQGLIPFYNDKLVQSGIWVANSFNLLNELPQVQTITRILVGGSGWDFESDIDNVSLKATVTNEFSAPGALLWMSYFTNGQYSYFFSPTNQQPFLDPNTGEIFGQDFQVWQYDFPIRTNVAFWQTNGNIYWLSVSAQSPNCYLGWKTALTNWNDDAVFGHVDNQWLPENDWQELFVPHTARSLDLAFSITTMWVVAPPVITNVWVTNQVTLTATNQVLGMAWTCENGVHYQVCSATNLTSTGSGITWTPCGPEIVGPSHWYWETNAPGLRRFYRVEAVDP